jgi:hypothetical protein
MTLVNTSRLRDCLRTFAKHFHEGSEERVTESCLSYTAQEGLGEFLTFVRNKLHR